MNVECRCGVCEVCGVCACVSHAREGALDGARKRRKERVRGKLCVKGSARVWGWI